MILIYKYYLIINLAHEPQCRKDLQEGHTNLTHSHETRYVHWFSDNYLRTIMDSQ
jgi:hypothetical protein